MAVAYTQAIYEMATITAVKSFIVQAHGQKLTNNGNKNISAIVQNF
jgi:hypothetical protein